MTPSGLSNASLTVSAVVLPPMRTGKDEADFTSFTAARLASTVGSVTIRRSACPKRVARSAVF